MSTVISIARSPSSAVVVFDDLQTLTITLDRPMAVALLAQIEAAQNADRQVDPAQLRERLNQAQTDRITAGTAEEHRVGPLVINTLKRTVQVHAKNNRLMAVPGALAHDILTLAAQGPEAETGLQVMATELAACTDHTPLDQISQLVQDGALLMNASGHLLLSPDSDTPALDPDRARPIRMGAITEIHHTLLGILVTHTDH